MYAIIPSICSVVCSCWENPNGSAFGFPHRPSTTSRSTPWGSSEVQWLGCLVLQRYSWASRSDFYFHAWSYIPWRLVDCYRRGLLSATINWQIQHVYGQRYDYCWFRARCSSCPVSSVPTTSLYLQLYGLGWSCQSACHSLWASSSPSASIVFISPW